MAKHRAICPVHGIVKEIEMACMWLLVVIIIISSIIAFICLLAADAVTNSVTNVLNVPNPDYDQYINIRDFSNCTVGNDTYCKEKYHICIHAYEYCQREQCSDYANSRGDR
jgi:exo-beta-1,3-glucanase (GH17 family)